MEVIKDTNHIPQLIGQVKELTGPEIKVGILEDAQGGTPEFTLAAIGAANEFGAKTKDGKQHIPPRPFLRTAFDDDETQKKVANPVKRIFIRGERPGRILKAMGVAMASAVRRKIRSNIPPKNADATIKRKGSDKTLRHLGRLIRGVDYEIV